MADITPGATTSAPNGTELVGDADNPDGSYTNNYVWKVDVRNSALNANGLPVHGIRAFAGKNAAGIVGVGGGGPNDDIVGPSNPVGVFGQGGSGDADGVQGVGSGSFSGVAGFGANVPSGTPGTGVFGLGGAVETLGGGGAPGVRGIGAGGLNTNPFPNPVGVYGRGGMGNADGVQGVGSGSFSAVAGFGGNNDGSGVFGFGGGTSGQGVRGIGAGGPNTTPIPSSPVGVYGQAGSGADGVQGVGSSSGAGVHGISRDVGGIGVLGHSDEGHGGTFESVDANGVTHSAQMRIVPAEPPAGGGVAPLPAPANSQLGDFFVRVFPTGIPPHRNEAQLWFFANVPASAPNSQNGWVRIV